MKGWMDSWDCVLHRYAGRGRQRRKRCALHARLVGRRTSPQSGNGAKERRGAQERSAAPITAHEVTELVPEAPLPLPFAASHWQPGMPGMDSLPGWVWTGWMDGSLPSQPGKPKMPFPRTGTVPPIDRPTAPTVPQLPSTLPRYTNNLTWRAEQLFTIDR